MMWQVWNGGFLLGRERRDPYSSMCWHVTDAMKLDAAGATGSWNYVWVRVDE